MTFETDDHAHHDVVLKPDYDLDIRPVPEAMGMPRQAAQWVHYCRDCDEVVR